MKLAAGAWDGAQPRTHVLKVLSAHGVGIRRIEDDWYELVDCDGDVVIQHLPNPVLRDIIPTIYRRFGQLHGFEITELVHKH